MPGAHFIEGDATRLSDLDTPRPITLALDMGGFHSLPNEAKPIYVAELAGLLEPGTPLMMWQGIRLESGEIAKAFGGDFVIEGSKAKDFTIKRKMFHRSIAGHWYRLRRR